MSRPCPPFPLLDRLRRNPRYTYLRGVLAMSVSTLSDFMRTASSVVRIKLVSPLLDLLSVLCLCTHKERKEVLEESTLIEVDAPTLTVLRCVPRGNDLWLECEPSGFSRALSKHIAAIGCDGCPGPCHAGPQPLSGYLHPLSILQDVRYSGGPSEYGL